MMVFLKLLKGVSLKISFLIICLALSSCSMISKKNISNQKNQNVKSEEKIENEKFSVKPGEVVKINFVKNSLSENAILECDEKKIPYYLENDRYVAFVAETYFTKFNDIKCFIDKYSKKTQVATISVGQKEFPSEKLNVDQRRVSLNAKDLKRVQKEQVFLNKNYSNSPSHPYFDEPFILPIDAFVTSIYGSRRLFNNSKQTQHLGTDFRAAVGEPIKATNSGKVVVARDLFFTGGTVTIDHGLGIFSIYGHLSKVQVQEGEFVPKGTQIGLAGATGRVTGPHLHWGVKVNGLFIEGESLVKESAD